MNTSVEISTFSIPKILALFRAATQSLVKIELCACEDFRSTKKILDQLENIDFDQIVAKSAKEKLSEIISDLQYVDVLQQRLAHVVSTTDVLRDDLYSFSQDTDRLATGFEPIIRLNLKQFQDAIDLYLNTTDEVHTALTEVSKNHQMLFLPISEVKSLYKYNTQILREATKVRDIYVEGLFKFQHPASPLAVHCVPQIKDIANLYTMEQERIVLDRFLKVELAYSNGYDIDSDKEQISFF